QRRRDGDRGLHRSDAARAAGIATVGAVHVCRPHCRDAVNGPILGWDIGGANVKAALVEHGSDAVIVERPFALWREPHRLTDVLIEIAGPLGPVRAMAVT